MSGRDHEGASGLRAWGEQLVAADRTIAKRGIRAKLGRIWLPMVVVAAIGSGAGGVALATSSSGDVERVGLVAAHLQRTLWEQCKGLNDPKEQLPVLGARPGRHGAEARRQPAGRARWLVDLIDERVARVVAVRHGDVGPGYTIFTTFEPRGCRVEVTLPSER